MLLTAPRRRHLSSQCKQRLSYECWNKLKIPKQLLKLSTRPTRKIIEKTRQNTARSTNHSRIRPLILQIIRMQKSVSSFCIFQNAILNRGQYSTRLTTAAEFTAAASLIGRNGVRWCSSLSNDQRVTVDRVSLQWWTVTSSLLNVNLRYILRYFCLRDIRIVVSIFIKYSLNILISAILQYNCYSTLMNTYS